MPTNRSTHPKHHQGFETSCCLCCLGRRHPTSRSSSFLRILRPWPSRWGKKSPNFSVEQFGEQKFPFPSKFRGYDFFISVQLHRRASSHPVDELLLEVLQNATHSEESPVPGSRTCRVDSMQAKTVRNYMDFRDFFLWLRFLLAKKSGINHGDIEKHIQNEWQPVLTIPTRCIVVHPGGHWKFRCQKDLCYVSFHFPHLSTLELFVK